MKLPTHHLTGMKTACCMRRLGLTGFFLASALSVAQADQTNTNPMREVTLRYAGGVKRVQCGGNGAEMRLAVYSPATYFKGEPPVIFTQITFKEDAALDQCVEGMPVLRISNGMVSQENTLCVQPDGATRILQNNEPLSEASAQTRKDALAVEAKVRLYEKNRWDPSGTPEAEAENQRRLTACVAAALAADVPNAQRKPAAHREP